MTKYQKASDVPSEFQLVCRFAGTTLTGPEIFRVLREELGEFGDVHLCGRVSRDALALREAISTMLIGKPREK